MPLTPEQEACDHIYGNMAPWPRTCWRCGVKENEVTGAALTQILESAHQQLTKPPAANPRDLIKEIAMDIGKAVAHHVETMYPDSVKNKSMLLSIRNTTYNEIIAAIQVTDEGEIIGRLARRKKHRRKINSMRRQYQNQKEKK